MESSQLQTGNWEIDVVLRTNCVIRNLEEAFPGSRYPIADACVLGKDTKEKTLKTLHSLMDAVLAMALHWTIYNLRCFKPQRFNIQK
jgi:hypothetical protein